MSLPHSTITPITDTNPSAVPSLWNVRYTEIDENFQDIDVRQEALETDVANARGDKPTLADKVTDIVSSVTSLDARTGALELDSAIAVSEAVKLDWLYRNMRFATELWTPNWTLLDDIEITVTEAVAGSQRVEVSDKSDLVEGEEYVIFDNNAVESVVVGTILTGAEAFEATVPLSNTFTNATLKRSSFTIENGTGTAEDGDMYFCGPLNLGSDDIDKALIIRRDDNDTELKLYYQDDTHTTWTEAHWEWRRTVEGQTGVIEVEYRVPSRDNMNLKLVAVAGTITSQVVIYHMVGVHADTALKGNHHPPEKPVNDEPGDGVQNINEVPTLSIAGYNSVVSSNQSGLQVQITTTQSDYASPAYDSEEVVPGGTSHSVPAGKLAVSTTYYWRMRVKDADGAWSDWSDETSFQTAQSFAYMATPLNQGPVDGAVDVPEQPTLSSTVGVLVNYQAKSLNDGSSNLWLQSGTTSTEYYYTGQDIGVQPTEVEASGSALTTGTLGSLAAGEWAWGNNDDLGYETIYVHLASGDPDGLSADTITCTPMHEASEWQIRNTAGTYDEPEYSSGEVADLTAHIVPPGKLQEGETDYYYRVRHKGTYVGWLDWSAETKFTTKEVFANIIGIALVHEGGGGGTWQRVDKDGSNKTTNEAFFNNHPVWGGIVDVEIASQKMVKIPKFYFKKDAAPTGSDQAGKTCWWISDMPADGFVVYPAFLDEGTEIDCFYVGKYENYEASSSPLMFGSDINKAPKTSLSLADTEAAIQQRNVSAGTEGFHLLTIYELAAIQLLFLIEKGTPDVVSAIAPGNLYSHSVAMTGATSAIYRGISELWGNVWHAIKGIRCTGDDYMEILKPGGTMNEFVSTNIKCMQNNGYTVSILESQGQDFDFNYLFMPASIGAAFSTGTLADCYNYINGSSYLFLAHGGNSSTGNDQGGIFALLFDATSVADYTGSRMAKY